MKKKKITQVFERALKNKLYILVNNKNKNHDRLSLGNGALYVLY